MNRLVISLIILMCVACVYGAIRPSQRVTEVEKVEQHNLVQEEIYKHINNIYDSLTAITNTNYPQKGLASTNAGGFDTIYLTTKYSSSDFSVQVTATTVSLVAAVPLSDSSFSVALFDHTGSGHSVSYRWRVEGALE